ncbi:MAG: alkaline phosphatase, partial [Gorillibacterium sp.]|nr:alkaline phosphatase [Gorillibacterium sp.]
MRIRTSKAVCLSMGIILLCIGTVVPSSGYGKVEAASTKPSSTADLRLIQTMDNPLGEQFNGTLALIGAEQTSQGAEFRLNLHLRTPDMDTSIDLIEAEIRYDRRLFEFVRATNLAGPALTEPGRLNLKINGGRYFRSAKPGEYRVSKICELYFRAKAPQGQGDFTVAGADFYVWGQRLPKEHFFTEKERVTIEPKPVADLSGDGMVTIGDLALAGKLSVEEQQQIANTSHYSPYKRVVVIGLDGAGISVSAKAPYFATLASQMTEVGDRYAIPNIRRIIESGAVSYSAHSTLPSYSSPNWGAMLTGVDYTKHKINNRISGKMYYDEASPYPTVFSKLRKAYPERKLASFAHWRNIGNGHMEPAAGVSLHFGTDESLLRQFKDYVGNGNAKDSSLIFMVLDEVDNAGHAHGWYSRKYYQALEKVDAKVGAIQATLQQAGLLEDTLLLLVADHGGGSLRAGGTLARAKHHGQDGQLATTMFIAASGRTVARGDEGEKLLTGGHTRDVASTILYALG